MSIRVDPVKGVQWNWLTFLWENVARIRKEQRMGDTVTALEQLCTLVWYCPQVFKNEFLDKAEKIEKEMVKLRNGVGGTSILTKHQNQNRAVEAFASQVFPSFIKQFTTELDSAGYMERRSRIPTGTSHTMLATKKKTTQ